MRRWIFPIGLLFLVAQANAGFKVKLIKPKKPEKFQVHRTLSGVTYAADLLLKEKHQKKFFAKPLSPSNIVVVRLAVFNKGNENVELPLDRLQLLDPDGTPVPALDADTVSRAILGGMIMDTGEGDEEEAISGEPGVRVVSGNPTQDPRTGPHDPRYDPRTDPSDPRYDPRSDPNDPRYDPGTDPRDPRYDPRTDPSDPSYDPRYSRNRRYSTPGVNVILNPGGSGLGDLSQFERQLVEKDFRDKEHRPEPILRSLSRDRFLYFSLAKTKSRKGFVLLLPTSKGILEEIRLEF